MKRALLVELQVARAKKRPAAVVTNVLSGDQLLVDGNHLVGDLTLDDAQMAAVRYAIEEDRSGLLDDSYIFVHVFNPPLRMIVVGAVHIAQALVPMAATADFAVEIIDPRTAFADEKRFAGGMIDARWPQDVFADRPLDAWCALVALTHDPKLDDPALEAALAARCLYVGALGSLKTHAKRLARLEEKGLDAAALAAICAPIGLDIGAANPAEIAVAILAEVIACRRRPERA